ncbi:MAG TPA: hypothetical protein VE825_05335 [Terriglobales bacterium]|jgi:hypothetical protein|nr:hypothetical protein [Terriglobales bacterium]
MTAYAGSEPLEPFSVPAKVLKRSAGEEGSTTPAASRREPGAAGSDPPSDHFDSPLAKIAAGLLFASVYALLESNPAFTWAGVLLLLLCTLYRLDARQRKIAAAPVAFASILLACQVEETCGHLAAARDAASMYQRAPVTMPNLVAPWLPLFFAVCLFYMPRFETCTGKILMITSLLLLVSGLLPGNGFEVIFITTQYFLFIAIVVGLAVDFARKGSAQTARASQ